MLDDWAMIRRITRVIDEHQVIRKHVKLVGDSVPDREALGRLRRTRTEWVSGQPEVEATAEKLKKLQQTLGFLDEGLKNHFALEEQDLPSLCGDLLMRAIFIEHGDIIKKIDQARSVVADAKLEGVSEEELMSQQSQIQHTIGDLLHLVEEHASKEEQILKMMQRALGEKTQKRD